MLLLHGALPHNHNTEACLPHATLSSDLAASACFPWASPTCFKKGMWVVQRTVLKPTGQRPAGGWCQEASEEEAE